MKIRSNLLNLIKKAGLTTNDIACVFRLHPIHLSLMLDGLRPMPRDLIDKIEKSCTLQIKKIKEEKLEKEKLSVASVSDIHKRAQEKQKAVQDKKAEAYANFMLAKIESGEIQGEE